MTKRPISNRICRVSNSNYRLKFSRKGLRRDFSVNDDFLNKSDFCMVDQFFLRPIDQKFAVRLLLLLYLPVSSNFVSENVMFIASRKAKQIHC